MAKVTDAYGVVQQQYAEDTQLYIAMSKMSSANAIVQHQNCVTALHQWFAENGLALNPDKSEAVLFSTSQRAKGLSVISTIDLQLLCPARSSSLALRWMGTVISMTRLRTCAERRFFHIRALRHIRPSLTEEMANVVACAPVQSRVDYANSLYTGMSSVNFDKLQLVQNTLARVVTLTRKRDDFQPSLKRLHWLLIRQRVDFKVALLTYSIHYSGEPRHRNSLLMDYKPTRSLRSAEEHLLVVPLTKLSSTSRAFTVAAPKL